MATQSRQVNKWKEFNEKKFKVATRLPHNMGGFGDLGSSISLRTNYFRVNIKDPKNITFYHYDVKIRDSRGLEASSLPTEEAAPAAVCESASSGRGKQRKGKGRGGKRAVGEEPAVAAKQPETTLVPVVSASGKDVEGKDQFGRKIPKTKQRNIFNAFVRANPKLFKSSTGQCEIAFDGEANAISYRKIEQLREQQPIDYYFKYEDELEGRSKEYRIRLELVRSLPLKSLVEFLSSKTSMSALSADSTNAHLYQMLQIIFNHECSLQFTVVGQNKFFSHIGMFGRPYELSYNKESVSGFFSSLRPVGWKNAGCLMLNVDVAHAAFYKVQSLIDFLKAERVSFEGGKFRDDDIKIIETVLIKKNIKVTTIHTINQKRRYKISGISNKNALNHRFDYEGRQVNVFEYFKERYNYCLKYPSFQCLLVGNVQKNSLMPVEVCVIAREQKVQQKLDDRETATFIKQTAIPPQYRLNEIKDAVKRVGYNNHSILKTLGVSIDEQPLSLEGRVLPPPVIAMDPQRNHLQVRHGVWDNRNHAFKNPAQLTKWAVINYDRYTHSSKVMDFVRELCRQGQTFGMNIANPCETIEGNWRNPARDLQYVYKKDLQLIMCVISSGDTYKMIKWTGDRELKIPTQCVQGKNVVKCSLPTISNLLLKINAKLGGLNHHSLYTNGPITKGIFDSLFSEPVIVMGADVNHPPAGDKDTPSLVAVVGSLNRTASLYATEVRHQTHRQEMIADMTEITVNLLKSFREATRGSVPQRIIMFRDGVSESQFTTVISNEMLSIRAACTSLNANYKPAITYICVQKRHHTRLFCSDMRQGVGKSGNVPPGTVVDRDITQLSEADFYLASHQGIQGTSKPSHYTVLWDDSDFNMNQLQLLTYALCHNYNRCTRSVSIPAPAYYAHLAAFRAKIHFDGDLNANPEKWRVAARGSDTGQYPEEALALATRVDRTFEMSKIPYYA